MSAILGLDSRMLEDLYDALLQKEKIPEETKVHLRTSRQKIQVIYKRIEGKWWRRGFWQRLYILENRLGKERYEIQQELKALKIALEDLNLIKKFFPKESG